MTTKVFLLDTAGMTQLVISKTPKRGKPVELRMDFHEARKLVEMLEEKLTLMPKRIIDMKQGKPFFLESSLRASLHKGEAVFDVEGLLNIPPKESFDEEGKYKNLLPKQIWQGAVTAGVVTHVRLIASPVNGKWKLTEIGEKLYNEKKGSK